MSAPKRIVQPARIDSDGSFTSLRKPVRWFWYAGKLYVGYDNGLSFWHSDNVLWDLEPVPLGAEVETCNGLFRFEKVLSEKRYPRKYAVLTVRYRFHPEETYSLTPRQRHRGQTIVMRERHVLPPNCVFSYQWHAPSQHPLIYRCDAKEQIAYWRTYDKAQREGKKKGLYPAQIKEPPCRHTRLYFHTVSLVNKWHGGENLRRVIARCKSLESLRFSEQAVEIRQQAHPAGCLRCFEAR